MYELVPAEVLASPLVDEQAWLELRDSGRTPLDSSPLVTTEQSRLEFLTGAWLINRSVPVHRGGPLLNHLQPQMLRMSDMLAAGYQHNAVLMPRRSAKTTALWCVLLGRAYLREVHMAGYAMLTTAQKAAARFKEDVLEPIERQWPEASSRPVKLIRSNGAMRIDFPRTGSKLQILSPSGDAIRSGGYDTVVLDEGGEPEPAVWEDMVASTLPTFDTRGPQAQFILAGTGGRYRTGSLFWQWLTTDDKGHIRYGIAADTDIEALTTWELVEPMVLSQHPGLDGLTTLEHIAVNFREMRKLRNNPFWREYMGYFDAASAHELFLSEKLWADSLGPGNLPEGVKPASLAMSVDMNGNGGSVAVAWHMDAAVDLVTEALVAAGEAEEPQRAGVKLLMHATDMRRFERDLYQIWRRVKLPIIHDSSPHNLAVIDKLMRQSRLRPTVEKLNGSQVKMANVSLLRGLEHGEILHWHQDELDHAAARAVPKVSGGGVYITQPPDDESLDITPLEAVAYAVGSIGPERKHIGPKVID